MADTPVVFDSSRIYNITERSDIDHHQNPKTIQRELEAAGEDWGDGFVVQDEMVVVTRSKTDGRILRTTPMSEALFMKRDTDDYEPIEGRAHNAVQPLSIEDQYKLVEILALRLFNWYKDQPPNPRQYNPVYDGIPELPAGSSLGLQPPPGTNLFPATAGQVVEWLKTNVIGPRAKIIDKSKGRSGYAGDYALRISR